MPEKNEIIANTYIDLGSKAQTLDRIKCEDEEKSEADPTYVPSGMTKKDVDHCFFHQRPASSSTESPLQDKVSLLRGVWSEARLSS